MNRQQNARDATDKGDGGHGPAGPHDRPELRNDDATPGAGTLPEDTPDDDADAGAG